MSNNIAAFGIATGALPMPSTRSIRATIVGMSCLVALAVSPTAALAQQKTALAPPELTVAVEKHQLQAEVFGLQKQNAELRAQLADLTARLDSIALSAAAPDLQQRRAQLEDFIRASVGAPADAPVDWSKSPPTVTWTPPVKPEEAKAPKP